MIRRWSGRLRPGASGAGPRRRALAALVAGAAGVLAAPASAAPAWAHGGDAPAATDYKVVVTAVTPSVPGVAVRPIDAGARLELSNHSGRTIEVLGYSGEPYLEVRPDGVYDNVNSPATYLNATLSGDAAVPANADPAASPSWRLVSAEPVARWHDHRAWWMADNLPTQVTADPSTRHRLRDWVVPLRDGVATVEIHGTLDWLPPPSPGLWWALGLAGVAALATLGALRRAGRAVSMVLAGVLTLGGLVAIAYAVGRSLDSGATGWAVPSALLTAQFWPVLTGLAALGAALYALTHRPGATGPRPARTTTSEPAPTTDFLLALAGTCLALFAGVTNAAAFARSVVPVPWPAAWGRVAVAIVIATGAGVAVAAVLRLRAVSGRAPAVAHPSPPGPA